MKNEKTIQLYEEYTKKIGNRKVLCGLVSNLFQVNSALYLWNHWQEK